MLALLLNALAARASERFDSTFDRRLNLKRKPSLLGCFKSHGSGERTSDAERAA
jgi:hypothetical protein